MSTVKTLVLTLACPFAVLYMLLSAFRLVG